MIKSSATLINPPSPPGLKANREGAGGLGNVYADTKAFVYPPQTIAYIAASLRSNGYKVRVVDCVHNAWDTRAAIGQLPDDHRPIFGVFISYPTFDHDLKFANELRSAFPEASIVLFGPVLSYLGEDAVDRTRSTLVLVGEPEVAFVEACRIVKDVDEGGQRIVRAARGRGEFLENLDALPVPAWDLCDGDRRWMLSVSASRGCGCACVYCPYVVAQGQRRRARSVTRVIEELQFLERKLKPQQIVFRDPVFAADRDWVVDLCESILRRGLKPRWQCESRPEHFDGALIALMKRSGCQEIKVGVETVDSSLLVGLARIRGAGDGDEYLAKAAKVIDDCRQVGLRSRVFVMTGLPGQTAQSIASTRAFLERWQPSALNVKRLEYYPGIGIGEDTIPEPQPEWETLAKLREEIETRGLATSDRPNLIDRVRRKVRTGLLRAS